MIKVLVLQALALQVQGRVHEATTALEQALSLAEPEGYVRTFIDEGAPMGELLREAARQGIAVEYVGRLLSALVGRTKGSIPAAEPSPAVPEGHPARREAPGRRPPAAGHRPSTLLVEPLSWRELEVLRLLAAGLSNKEIAQRLVIALGTVKNHLKNIYGKLGVRSRTQAIVRAQELGLLQ